MDRYELFAALQEARVDPRTYAIEGIDNGSDLAEGAGILSRSQDGRWCVMSWERGTASAERWFDSEDDACRYLYDVFTADQPAPVAQTPGEEAASAEINRRREAEYRQWLASKGHSSADGH
jgi:hypothetical protein